MSEERWFAARAIEPGQSPVRLLGQPMEGFADVGEVMEWLEKRGAIEHVEPVGDEPWWRGWGDPYCAVAGSRDDPWEIS